MWTTSTGPSEQLRLTRRRFLLGAAVVGGIGLAAACAPAAPPPPTAAPAAPTAAAKPASAPATVAPGGQLSKASIKIADVATIPTIGQATQVGLTKGFFKQVGFDSVDYTHVAPGTTHLQALIGGSIDFSVNLNTDTMADANAKGEKVYIISGLTNKMGYAIVAMPDLKSLQDLKGKKLGVDTAGGSVDHIARAILKAAGIEPDRDVTMVPIQGAVDARATSLLAGATQATVLATTQLPDLEGQGVHSLADASAAFPAWQASGVAVRGDLLDKNPDAVVAYLKGEIRTMQFINDKANNAELATIMRDAGYKIDDATWPRIEDLQRDQFPTDLSVDMAGVDAVIKQEKDGGRVPADYTADKLLRLDLLKQAQKELGLA